MKRKFSEMDSSDDEGEPQEDYEPPLKKRKLSIGAEISADHLKELQGITFEKPIEDILKYLHNFQNRYIKDHRRPIWFGTPMLLPQQYVDEGIHGFIRYHFESLTQQKALCVTGFPTRNAVEARGLHTSSQYYSQQNQNHWNMSEIWNRSSFFMKFISILDQNMKKANKVVEKGDWEWLKSACAKVYSDTEVQHSLVQIKERKYGHVQTRPLFSSFDDMWSYVDHHWKSFYVTKHKPVGPKSDIMKSLMNLEIDL
jgi:hypothetical protein